ncbi:acetyltransferase (GNAT) family protein [Burkholderia cenocepacia]|nr:GCN5-related N-acetyltransferase [Burkholderia cenocepacia KC-01]QND98737.1 acetyltransferase (GNAT) family protein [Burkholderia cenocepacia]
MPNAEAWRLRGMAVHPSVRGLGFGRLLVNLSIRHVREQRGTLLWCTARESAYQFYEMLGFNRDPIPISLHGRDDMKFYLMQRPIEC